MQRKKVSELFGKVDPELKAINGASYRRHHNKRLIRLDEKAAIEAYRYECHISTNEDWEKAVISCPVCGQPTVRLLSYGFLGKRKVRPECIERRARVLEYKARLFEARWWRRQPGAGWACVGYADQPQAEILGK